jgi:hypothetical protein
MVPLPLHALQFTVVLPLQTLHARATGCPLASNV